MIAGSSAGIEANAEPVAAKVSTLSVAGLATPTAGQ